MNYLDRLLLAIAATALALYLESVTIEAIVEHQTHKRGYQTGKK